MKKFIFYDTETTGLKELNYVQVIQIGSLLTDDNFKDLDSFDLICAPLPWTLVTPKALLVNKKAEIFNHPQTHYELIKRFMKLGLIGHLLMARFSLPTMA